MASIKDQIEKIVSKKAKLANGRTIEQTLMEAVDYLYICIQREIDNMYEEYTPKVYERRPWHEGLRSALYAEDFLDARIKGNSIEVSLKFSNNVWAWNFNHTHKSPVNVLMNNGWAWNSRPLRGIERFTDYGGYHFIEKGCRHFNETNRWGVTITPIIDNSNWY
jgi:hypothetical protein